MTYTASQYMQDALRTRSEIYRPDLVDHDMLAAALNRAMEAGEYMRMLKRACYGGKKIEDVPEFECDEAIKANLNALSPDMLHAIMGIVNEAGELAKMVYGAIFEGKPFDMTNFIEEGGDSEWFWKLGYHAAGVAPEEVMRRNIAKLKARFPDKFTVEANENRDLDRERAVLEGEVPQTAD